MSSLVVSPVPKVSSGLCVLIGLSKHKSVKGHRTANILYTDCQAILDSAALVAKHVCSF